MDKLTKSAHFIPVRMDYSMDRQAKLYVDEIVRLHGVLLSIMSLSMWMRLCMAEDVELLCVGQN